MNDVLIIAEEGISSIETVENAYLGNHPIQVHVRRFRIDHAWLVKEIESRVDSMVRMRMERITDEVKAESRDRAIEVASAKLKELRDLSPEHAQALAMLIASGESLAALKALNKKELAAMTSPSAGRFPGRIPGDD